MGRVGPIKAVVDKMAKRKSIFEVDQLLPNDEQLGARTVTWKSFMDKYTKNNEEEEILLEKVCEMLDYDASDQSNASDVQTDPDADDENFEKEFNREVVENQLVEEVARRKSVWETSGLMKLMKAVEESPNMPSHLKVEKWLFNQNTGPFDLTQNSETIVTERNADGDRMRYSRKQEVTISRDVDDADSLSTVDEKNYILQNTKDRNVTSKIKVIQTFRIKTNSATAFAMQPNLHAISNFPIHEDEPTTSINWLNKPIALRSDSAFQTGEDQLQTRLFRRFNPAPAALPSSSDNRRKKVFKKTVKKKSNLKSPSKKEMSGTQQYESALQSCAIVKKVPTRRIHWQEMSLIAESSSDESDKVIVRNTRSKAKSTQSPQRVLRSKSITPEVSPRKLTSRRRIASPRKTVDRELVGTFNSICLSPTKKLPNRHLKQLPPRRASTEQNANLTALFSKTNEKIANSTISNNTTTFSNKSMVLDASQGIAVFKPKAIQSEVAPDARVRITSKDLELANVSKARHLKSFQKFDYLIHPNSTVLFFPSDSEDDEPLATQTTTTNTDGDLSFDEDDPILTFKPRSTGRLNVMEYRYH